MSTDRSRLATRLALESFVIIGSILAAFALDTWWDQRQERAEEQETLSALQVEFEQARMDVEWYGSGQVRILDAVTLLVDELHAAWRAGRRTVTLPDTALGLAYVPPTVSPTLGTLEGLVSSGRLGLLRDRELRTALGGWGTELAELTEEETSSRDLTEEDLDRVLRARINTVGLWDVGAAIIGETLTPEARAGMREVPVDTEVMGVLEQRRTLLYHTRDEYADLRAEIDNILALIERSLNR